MTDNERKLIKKVNAISAELLRLETELEYYGNQYAAARGALSNVQDGMDKIYRYIEYPQFHWTDGAGNTVPTKLDA